MNSLNNILKNKKKTIENARLSLKTTKLMVCLILLSQIQIVFNLFSIFTKQQAIKNEFPFIIKKSIWNLKISNENKSSYMNVKKHRECVINKKNCEKRMFGVWVHNMVNEKIITVQKNVFL